MMGLRRHGEAFIPLAIGSHIPHIDSDMNRGIVLVEAIPERQSIQGTESRA